MSAGVSQEQSQEYYEDFSLQAAQRDWLSANPRHEQLKELIRQLLGRRRGMVIADVGCAGGTLTDFMTRYGRVTGVDFSSAAIEQACQCASKPTFLVGGLEALPDPRYDLITLFDVLEHIPADDRPGFLGELRERLVDDGLLFCSTPFPEWTRQARAEQRQIIDEEVELPTILAEAADAGLQLIGFQAYDVFEGSPSYQAMVFTPHRRQGGSPILQSSRLVRRLAFIQHPIATRGRRVRYAVRAVRRGDLQTARWFVTAPVPNLWKSATAS